MVDWAEVLKTVGSAGVIVAAGAFLLREAFRHLLSGNLEKFKAELSAKHDIEIERLRSDLKIAASEHETRFTRLHEIRVPTIVELYKRLIRAHEAFDSYLRPIQLAEEPDQTKKAEEAMNRANEFIEYFSEKRLYFEESLCIDIDAATRELRIAWVERRAYPPGMPGRGEQWLRTVKAFNDSFPPIRVKIEQLFREMIGVHKPQSKG